MSCASSHHFGALGGGLGRRFGPISGTISSNFRAIFAANGRVDEKASTCTKHWPCAAESTFGPAPGDRKSTENRSRKALRGALAKELSKRASRDHFLVASGSTGSARGRPEVLRGRPESSPNVSRSAPGASPKPPLSPQIAPKAPRSDFGRFLDVF